MLGVDVRGRTATSPKAAATITVANKPQPASSTCGQSASHVTDKSMAPKPGSTSQWPVKPTASTRSATFRIAKPCTIRQNAAAPPSNGKRELTAIVLPPNPSFT